MVMKMKEISAVVVMAALCSSAAHAQASEPASCEQVRFATVGWSDIEATTAVSTYVLQTLGCKTEVFTLSVPETFAALKAKKVDVFLGYWSPTQDSMVQPLQKDGSLKVLDRPNLANARYTLAVPEYLYEQGLKSFADIAKFKAELGGQIHGIEPGNDGNGLVQKMIKANQFNLGGFALVESSENGMVEALSTAVRAKKPIVFLGWEPHPMNLRSPIRYLSGGDDVFGPNFGASKVYTMVASGLDTRCPNLYTFLKNFRLTADQQSWIMLDTFESSKKSVGKTWVKVNKEILKPWLSGVRDKKGNDAEATVRAALAAP
jgi:glycine betaine/proline transport system substrate-binding protein